MVSPSDLAVFRDGVTLRVGGRVLAVDGGAEVDRVVLGDALGRVVVRWGAGLGAVQVGDLIEVDGRWGAGVVDATQVASRVAPRSFGGAASDTTRLTFAGGGHALVARARALSAVRAVFEREGFVEVDTPALVPSPGLDVHLDAVACDGGFLITSPEYQMKRLVTGGLPRVFQIARCFRRGEVGRQHNPEFAMLEWYRAFAGYDDVMADTEAVVRAVVAAVGREGVLRGGGREIEVGAPFERVTVAQAFSRYAGVGEARLLELAEHDEAAYFEVLVGQVEPALAEATVPVFLIDYPASQASLARRKPDDPRFCERFELYACGVELCNGFGELTDPVEQRARFEADRAARARLGKPVYPIDERFVAALEEGLPRCAGNALGLDRLVALALGAPSIGEVQAFPSAIV